MATFSSSGWQTFPASIDHSLQPQLVIFWSFRCNLFQPWLTNFSSLYWQLSPASAGNLFKAFLTHLRTTLFPSRLIVFRNYRGQRLWEEVSTYLWDIKSAWGSLTWGWGLSFFESHSTGNSFIVVVVHYSSFFELPFTQILYRLAEK